MGNTIIRKPTSETPDSIALVKIKAVIENLKKAGHTGEVELGIVLHMNRGGITRSDIRHGYLESLTSREG